MLTIKRGQVATKFGPNCPSKGIPVMGTIVKWKVGTRGHVKGFDDEAYKGKKIEDLNKDIKEYLTRCLKYEKEEYTYLNRQLKQRLKDVARIEKEIAKMNAALPQMEKEVGEYLKSNKTR